MKNHTKPHHPFCAKRSLIGSAIATLMFPTFALDFKLSEDIHGKFTGTVTLGTSYRTEGADSAVLGSLSTARVGLPAGQLGGNSGGNDLNFQKGKPVSSVLKGLFDLQLQRQDTGVAVRLKAWHDFELNNGSRPYGNSVNGFAQNVPLGDSGFDEHAKFSNAKVEDISVFSRFKLPNNSDLDVRLGRHVLNWSAMQMTPGVGNFINPVDQAAAVRPGALPEETRIPVGMLSAKLPLSKITSLEGFVQYEFRSQVLNGCGTFFAVANYAPTGCNYVSVLGAAGVNDPTGLSSGRYPKRLGDVQAGASGQWGFALRHKFEKSATDAHVFIANYHSRTPSIQVTNPNIAGGYGTLGATPTRLTDPNGLKYAMIYPENIHVFGLGASKVVDPTLRIYGEVAVRPNQPLSINASDMIAAFLQRSATSALNRAKNVLALAPGATFDGYDRYRVANLNMGLAKSIANAAGARQVNFSAELGLSSVAGLPDPGVLRYGRSDDYGQAAVTGGAACVDTTPAQKTCAQEGFVTKTAWGYRLRAAATYPGALWGATLTPSLTLTHDVRGNSFDGAYLEGRRSIRPALRADWGRKYYVDMQYNRLSGGKYNTQTDRDTFVLVGGFRF